MFISTRQISPGQRLWPGGKNRVRISFLFLLLLGFGLNVPAQKADLAERDTINPGLGPRPARVLRSTPAATWRTFLTLSRSGQYTLAAHLLDLSEVDEQSQRTVGADVAQKLQELLSKLGAREDDVTDDDPAGPKIDGVAQNVVIAGRFARPETAGEIWLRRTRDRKSGETAWLFTRQTVSNCPVWYQLVVQGAQRQPAETLNAGLGETPATVHRLNPRMTLTEFLDKAKRGEFGPASFYLDLNAYPAERQKTEGARLARRLMLVLLRNPWVDLDSVSNDEFGVPEKDYPPDVERLARVKVRDQWADILLQQHSDPKLGTVWTFSRGTVALIDPLYRAHGYGWLGDQLPAIFFSASFAGLQLWQWTGLLLILLFGWGVAWLLSKIVVGLFSSIAARTRAEWDDDLVRAIDGPMGLVLWGLLVSHTAPWIGLTPTAQLITTRGWKLLTLLGLGWLMCRLVDSTAAYLRRVSGEKNPVGIGFLPIMSRFAKVMILALILLGALDVIGVEVVGLLAGLGLGGVAVAFAAQKTIENLFGAVAIAGDHPFRVGDYIKIDEVTGTVEDVGLRSTRVRTQQRTVVTIPNSAVSGAKIVNYGARDRFLYNPTITLAYDSTADQLRFIIDELKKMLLSDPRIYGGEQRVRFTSFSPSSLDVEICGWIMAADWYASTGIAEELNFRVMEIVQQAGTSFALPAQMVYLRQCSGPDPRQIEGIAAEVVRRRESGELTLPETPAVLREKLRPAGPEEA